jgi:hypothetical protein
VSQTPVLAETLCECCLRCYRNGRNRRVPAAYVWTCEPSGYEASLCVGCTAIWRANAVDDPSLAPSRIRSIGAAA